MNKKCFVISAIGDKGSDIRKNADDLYDLIIEPALEKFGFDIIRADKISNVTSITSDIVELLQKSDLCVVDITGHNPNVMYECGRRHETAKPYIMLAKEGEKLPFDINTIRTIFYNLSVGREIRATVKSIQAVVEPLFADGFVPESPGDSLASISTTLKRIERKIDDMTMSPKVSGSTGPITSTVQEVLKALGPAGALKFAISQNDVSLAESLLPVVERTSSKDQYEAAIRVTAAMGSRHAIQLLEKYIFNIRDLDIDTQKNLLSAYTTGTGRHDDEERALEVLRPFFEHVKSLDTDNGSISRRDKGFFLNQYQKLLYGLEKFDEARLVGEQVISLCPDDPSYYYNQSLTLDGCDDVEGAVCHIDQCMSLDETKGVTDGDHLRRAVKLYARKGMIEKAKKAFVQLKKVNPFAAKLIEDEDDIMKIISR